MMTFEQFSQAETLPDGISDALRALWLAKKGQWEKAHEVVQNLPTPEAALVHAWLHRKEGDDANAAYWYQRAGKKICTHSLEAEWEHTVRNLLFS